MSDENEHKTALKRILENDDKAIKLALFNANRHHRSDALLEWESKEPGSIAGMIRAYKKMLNSINEDLSINVINEIRNQFLTEKNTYGNNAIVSSKNKNNDINITKNVYFNLPSTFLDKDRIQAECSILKKKIKLDKEDPYIIKSIEDRIRISTNIKIAYNAMQTLINNYNYQKEKHTEKSIIEFVRDLERIHPYPDFNCRTFCVLLLNRELIKNGFSPTILEDPNKLDYETMENMEKLIKDGQKHFCNLHEEDASIETWKASFLNFLDDSSIKLSSLLEAGNDNLYKLRNKILILYKFGKKKLEENIKIDKIHDDKKYFDCIDFSTEVLHWIVEVGDQDMLKLALQHPEVKINIKNCDNETPLDLVKSRGDKTMERILSDAIFGSNNDFIEEFKNDEFEKFTNDDEKFFFANNLDLVKSRRDKTMERILSDAESSEIFYSNKDILEKFKNVSSSDKKQEKSLPISKKVKIDNSPRTTLNKQSTKIR